MLHIALCCLEGSTNTRCLTSTLLPGGQYQHKMSHKHSAAWRAVRQRTGAKLPPVDGNHCGSRGAFLISYLHWLFIQSHIIRSLPPSLSKYLGEVSCRSTHRCIRLLQVHRALWECFLRSGIGIHWWWVLREKIIRLHHYGRDPAEPGARLRGY